MRKFIEVNQDGSWRAAFDWAVEGADPAFSDDRGVPFPVEVTGVDPAPGPGWSYDRDAQTWAAP
jgi:hypothetical protein